MSNFNIFLKSFPKSEKHNYPVNIELAKECITDYFKIVVPDSLLEFWDRVGSGYFGANDLYFFGDGSVQMPRESIFEWNNRKFWHSIYPKPKDGGPFFFAETCFGDQIGFRYENDKIIILLFVIDIFESFVLSHDFDHFFSGVLNDKYALVEPSLLNSVNKKFGHVTDGMHYSPIISPMIGGNLDSDNFTMETPSIHFAQAIEIYKTTKELKKGTDIVNIKIS